MTTFTHDANRELTGVLLPLGKRLFSVPGYCCGTTDTLVDAAGSRTHWEYDVLGRVTGKWLRWGPGGQGQVNNPAAVQTYRLQSAVPGAQLTPQGLLKYTVPAKVTDATRTNISIEIVGRKGQIYLQEFPPPHPAQTSRHQPASGGCDLTGSGSWARPARRDTLPPDETHESLLRPQCHGSFLSAVPSADPQSLSRSRP